MKLSESKLRRIIRDVINEQTQKRGQGFSIVTDDSIKDILGKDLNPKEASVVDLQPVADVMNDILSNSQNSDELTSTGERTKTLVLKKIYNSLLKCFVAPGTKVGLRERYRIENFAATLYTYFH